MQQTMMDASPEPYGIPCGLEGCTAVFSSTNTRKVHIRSVHQTAVSITLPNGEQRTIERNRGDQMFHCPFCTKFSQANAGNFGKHVRICRGGGEGEPSWDNVLPARSNSGRRTGTAASPHPESASPEAGSRASSTPAGTGGGSGGGGGVGPVKPEIPSESAADISRGWSAINGATSSATNNTSSAMEVDAPTPAPESITHDGHPDTFQQHSPQPALTVEEARAAITSALMDALMELSRRSLYSSSSTIAHSFSSSSTSINIINAPESASTPQEIIDASIDGIKSTDTTFQTRCDKLAEWIKFIDELRVPEACTPQKRDAMLEIVNTALRTLVELSASIKQSVREGKGSDWERINVEIEAITKRCTKLIKTVLSLGRKDGLEKEVEVLVPREEDDDAMNKRNSVELDGGRVKKMRTG